MLAPPHTFLLFCFSECSGLVVTSTSRQPLVNPDRERGHLSLDERRSGRNGIPDREG